MVSNCTLVRFGWSFEPEMMVSAFLAGRNPTPFSRKHHSHKSRNHPRIVVRSTRSFAHSTTQHHARLIYRHPRLPSMTVPRAYSGTAIWNR
jgi:hypothetical protein